MKKKKSGGGGENRVDSAKEKDKGRPWEQSRPMRN